jgi:mono/diheme cytochrome c family protein
MTRLPDILLPYPLSGAWLHAVLFLAFALHFLFVLLTLGTAIFATLYYVAGQWGGPAWLRTWDKDFLEWFFAHKSLAVVLGVGPILMMQMGNSVPFLTGVHVVAPLWMLVTVCLILSLALYEWQHRRTRERRWGFLLVSTLALFLIVYVPATFVAVLSTAERPGSWAEILRLGSSLPRLPSLHWVLRLLHVLGAAVVVTAAMHYLGGERDENRRRHMLGWIAGGLAFQFAVGVGLFASVRPIPSFLPTVTTVVGVAAAGILAFATSLWRKSRGPSGLSVGLLVSLIILPMLLTRQILQDRVLVPLVEDLRANAAVYATSLAPYRGQAELAFAGTLAVPYDNGLAIYSRSCSFCHGAVGNGRGDEAGRLSVQPENLPELRMTRDKLDQVLRYGIAGSAMPVFDYYLESELALLRAFLRDKVGMRESVEPVPRRPSSATEASARQLYDGTCSVCHGADGHGSPRGLAFAPPVPDFARLSPTPARAFQVVTQGYPGTMMRSFASEPEEVRWALVQLVQDFYRGGRQQSPASSQPEGKQ